MTTLSARARRSAEAVDIGFAVFVVASGQGRLDTASGAEDALAVRCGSTVLAAYGAGSVRVSGTGGPVEVLRCRPPAPAPTSAATALGGGAA